MHQVKCKIYNKHEIKIDNCVIGSISHNTWDIRFMVIKKDIGEDGNTNCPWKWILLKHKSKTLDEAKSSNREPGCISR